MTDLAAKAADWQTMKDELDMARANYQYLKQDTDNEIAALRRRIEELEKALEPFADAYKGREGWDGDWIIGGSPIRNCHLRTAARALKGE